MGRLGWHNPGHAAVIALCSLLPWPAEITLRLLQILAGLIAGLATQRLLARFASPRVALAGAFVVWLHPVQLFFRLTLWPVAMSTAGVALLLLALQRVREAPQEPRRALDLAAVCALLPLWWPAALGGLLLLPLALVRWAPTRRAGIRLAVRTLSPALLVTLLSSLLATATLGTPSVLGLSGPENLALGNNPFVPPGRGSSLHDAGSVERLRFEAARPCPVGQGALTVRCVAREHRRIAGETIAADPGGAVGRAMLRVVETWAPDDFVARHLADPRIEVALPKRAVGVATFVAELGILLGLVAALVAGHRDPRVLAGGLALLLCTLPVLAAVGLTRVRQPLLPLIVLLVVAAWRPGSRGRGRYTRPP